MTGSKRRSCFGLIIAGLIIAFSLSPQFRAIYSLPPHLLIIEGESKLFSVSFPLSVSVCEENQDSMLVTSSPSFYGLSRPVVLKPEKLGAVTVVFRLFGFIPVRSVQVDVLPPIQLVPGGHSIGVVLHSQGVIVVGYSPVESQGGGPSIPAKEVGINIGDVILSINGIPAQSDTQVAEIIDSSGQQQKKLEVLLKRQDERLNITLSPVLCNETKRFRIGLFVRDSAAGVGTLTFYDPKTRIYGALGHVITDNDTNQPIDCDKGKIVLATVSGIQYGKRGQPGEKIGVFIEEDNLLGNIQKNTAFGIYGNLEILMKNNLYPEAISIASMSQVQTGYAEMLTVIDGQTIERFSIDIEKVNLQNSPEGKGLVIKVTDKNLLEKTGGIVQGMSGSPILQNGKIVGAVTHVFVHDPTKGYGCFVDWMLMESGLIPKKAKLSARKLFTFSGIFI